MKRGGRWNGTAGKEGDEEEMMEWREGVEEERWTIEREG